MPRKKYPSDHRRWFRAYEDMIDDPALNGVSDACFRFYWRLLAMLNRTKCRDGVIRLDRFALNACARREQRRHALSTASEGAEAGLYSLREDGVDVVIAVRKWPELQELTPTELRQDSDVTPSPKTTPKTTPKKNASPTRSVRSGRSPKPIEDQPPEALEFATRFRAAMEKTLPGWKPPADSAFAGWVDSARLMLSADGRPPDEAADLASWLFGSDSDDAGWWRAVVRSVTKFRTQYDTLNAVKRRGERPKPKSWEERQDDEVSRVLGIVR